ncbi:MAG: hypothetical protein J0M02_07170 [Planctomycetes bacterium]|nr:hypothetical protein [Planctomycetota bacterium]
MSEQLDRSVAHLRDLSSHLNQVTDQATAAVRRVETFLNQECRLGIAVYVPVGTPAPDGTAYQLGYDRCGGRFRIIVRTLRLDVGEDGQAVVLDSDETPWSDCARAAKLDAFQQLPALLDALRGQLTEVIGRADAAVAAAQRITDVLGAAPETEACDADCDEERRGRHEHGQHHGRHHGHHHGRGCDEGPCERERRNHGGGRFPDDRRRG